MYKVEFRFKSGRVFYRTLDQDDLDVIFDDRDWAGLQQITFEDAEPIIFNVDEIEYVEAVSVNG